MNDLALNERLEQALKRFKTIHPTYSECQHLEDLYDKIISGSFDVNTVLVDLIAMQNNRLIILTFWNRLMRCSDIASKIDEDHAIEIFIHYPNCFMLKFMPIKFFTRKCFATMIKRSDYHDNIIWAYNFSNVLCKFLESGLVSLEYIQSMTNKKYLTMDFYERCIDINVNNIDLVPEKYVSDKMRQSYLEEMKVADA